MRQADGQPDRPIVIMEAQIIAFTIAADLCAPGVTLPAGGDPTALIVKALVMLNGFTPGSETPS